MPQTLKVKCPRCGKLWTLYDGDSDVDCTCHLFCSEGTKPSDCTLLDALDSAVPDVFKGQYAYPAGMHLGRDKEADNIPRRMYYCTTHSKFTQNQAVTISADWGLIKDHQRVDKRVRFDREV
jgi:hypothetical protein